MRAIFLGFAAFVGGCDRLPTALTTSENKAVQGAPIGRFTIVHSPHVQRDTVLLDTATGKTWQLVEFSFLEDEPVGWAPMSRQDNNQEWASLTFNHSEKKPAKQNLIKADETAVTEKVTPADTAAVDSEPTEQ